MAFRWEIKHNCGRVAVVSVLRNFGFKASESTTKVYEKEIDGWQPARALVNDTGIVFELHYGGTRASERYFDYLLHAGVTIGQIMMRLDQIAEMTAELRQDLDNNEEDDND